MHKKATHYEQQQTSQFICTKETFCKKGYHKYYSANGTEAGASRNFAPSLGTKLTSGNIVGMRNIHENHTESAKNVENPTYGVLENISTAERTSSLGTKLTSGNIVGTGNIHENHRASQKCRESYLQTVLENISTIERLCCFTFTADEEIGYKETLYQTTSSYSEAAILLNRK